MSVLEQIFGWRLDSNESSYYKYNHIFSVWHFVTLGIIIGVIITLCLISRKKDKKWNDKMFIVIAIILLVLEVLRITYRTITYCCYEIYLPDHGNIYNWAEIISFALCTMVTYFSIVTLLINKEKWNKFAFDAIFPIALFSGSTALIYPDMLNTYYPIYHIMNIQTLITHGLLIALPFLLITSKRLSPNIKNMWKPMLTIFVFSMIARLFSKIADCSFMYMNEGIEVIPGWENKPFYTYYWILVLVFATWTALCYLPSTIKNHIKKKKEIKATTIEFTSEEIVEESVKDKKDKNKNTIENKTNKKESR